MNVKGLYEVEGVGHTEGDGFKVLTSRLVKMNWQRDLAGNNLKLGMVSLGGLELKLLVVSTERLLCLSSRRCEVTDDIDCSVGK